MRWTTLGLRSVVLISESILPDAHSGREVATAAARGALAAVLSTPAGATPPDPTRTENSLESTDILPAIQTPSAPAQAYSAAISVDAIAMARPLAAPVDPPASDDESSEPAATKMAPPVVIPAPRRSRRTLILIAAAAAIGLLLGGVAVGLALQGGGSANPRSSDARLGADPDDGAGHDAAPDHRGRTAPDHPRTRAGSGPSSGAAGDDSAAAPDDHTPADNDARSVRHHHGSVPADLPPPISFRPLQFRSLQPEYVRSLLPVEPHRPGRPVCLVPSCEQSVTGS